MQSIVNIHQIVDQIERQISERPEEGTLPRAQVEALDVVYHALVFNHHPRGLALWREALWQRRLPEEARQAVVEMLKHVSGAVAHGEAQAASRICNCLQIFVDTILGDRESCDPLSVADEEAAAPN